MIAIATTVICGLATSYSPGDKFTPNHGVMANGEKYNAKNKTIAHRTLPLNTWGMVCNMRAFFRPDAVRLKL